MLTSSAVPAFCASVLFITFSAFGQNTALPVAYTAPSSQLPPIGLAVGETAQVNVVNTAVVNTAVANTATPSGGPAPSCTGTITFYNSTGAIIGTAASFTVGSGQIFSATLPFASIGASGLRTVIRAAIALSSGIATLLPPVPQPSCALAFSLETYDNSTGVTHSLVSGTAPGPIAIFLRPGASPSVP